MHNTPVYMNRFLLITFIALPSFLFAQAPTLTFTPVDGSVNVNPANNMIILSDQPLKNADGSTIEDPAALITLTDNSLNLVDIVASINGPKTQITVNPTADLAEYTTYTLTIAPVENGGGQETTMQSITFTTGDFADPVINMAKGVDNTGAFFTFKVNVNEGATVYYVVDADGTTPSETEILAGENGDGNPAAASGSLVVTANTEGQVSISGLDFTPPDKFHIYFFAEDDSGNTNRSPVTTRGLPLLNSSSIQALGAFQFDLRVNVDEAVTTWYVVTQSATAPTATQILAGQNDTGGTPYKSGSFAVASANTDTDHTITGLTDGVTYYVHFVSTDSDGNQTIVETETATTPDGTPPTVSTLTPADGSMTVDISTNTFTLTFTENVRTINVAAADDTDRIRLFENGVMVETIDRDDTTVGTSGAIDADGTSNIATITFVYDLSPFENYYIVVGEDVFEDLSSNPFGGLLAPTDWNFAASGVTVNNATSNICSGSFQSIGNIVISETGIADFNDGASQTLILSLDNTAEFVISNSGVTATGTSADITSLSVSVGMTSLTVTYSVVGGTVADNITISGLKIYATGDVANTTIIRTGGTADQDGNNGTGGSSLIYATINVGTTPPTQPQLEASQDLIHCVDEDISAKTLTLVDQGAVTYNWYTDEALSTLATSTASPTVNIVSELGMTSPAVAGIYNYYVVTVSSCQSAPPVKVTLQVSINPIADAGADKIGVNAVCTGTQVTLGGNPTLSQPSTSGTYTYAWEYIESTPEPNAEANPVYTVTNVSTTTTAAYNFEVTVTDINGCFGTDMITIEVKPAVVPYLVSPTSSSFTPTSPNQTLTASPAGGSFSGVGVVQSDDAPLTYQFSPSIAHATDPNTLPKDFDIYYTVTSNGCSVSNYLIATFTISNSFFINLQPAYCSSEYPNPASSGVNLSLDSDGNTFMLARENDWNTNSRFSRVAHVNWVSGGIYGYNTYVRYNNEFYRCNNILGCTGFTTPNVDGQYLYENILRVAFNGLIRNYYEDYYGGNASGPTVVKSASTYTVDGDVYNFYRFGTNENYNNCPGCNYAYPAAYLEFERPEDIKLMLPVWNPGYYYYTGDLVIYNNLVYRCVASPYTYGTQPDLYPGLWTNVTNTDYANGQYFHKWDATLNAGSGAFRSGYFVRGQFVQINRNPTVFFSGLADQQDLCEFDVLNLDDVASSNGNVFTLTGNYSNQSLVQEFLVRLDGSGVFDYGGGAVANNIINPGIADFNTKTAFLNSPGGSSSVKNIEIQYKVDPGTTGSTLQPCYGSSNIIVQVLENSTFDFDDSLVDPEGSVYCYTEAAKGLRSVVGATVISGAAGASNSVVYSGYGVNDLGNSLGTFTPAVAVDQVSPGTTITQSIPVTALYRDASKCESTRIRTFKVTPDIKPAFTFGGRVNYCYEDIPNGFVGHFEDFTYNSSTVTSTGSYDFVYRDPANNPHALGSVNTTNTSFTAQPFYDQIQTILTSGGFTADLNQTVNLNVIYTETLNAGKVCSETFAQSMVINPPLVLDIFGLNSGDVLCRNSNVDVSQGNVVSFDGSITGSGLFKLDDDPDFSAVNPTLNSTVNTSSGKATINLLSAYNAASDPTDPKKVFLQYQYTGPGCTGPADVIKEFEISPPPSLAFDFGVSPTNLEVFCYDEAPVQLATVENTNVTLSGYGITDSGAGSGTGSFNPQLAYNTSISNGGTLNTQQNILVTARIIDGVGCANVNSVQYYVNPIPQAGLNTGDLYYCYEDAPRVLQGQQAKSWFSIIYQGVSTPFTDNIGDINNPVSQISFDPEARFDHAISLGASALTPVDFNVLYTVADNNNCTNTLGPYTLSVANQIEVSIAGLDNNDIYCSNENSGIKVLSFNPFPADATKRDFTINGGQAIPLTSEKYNFNPGLAGGDFTLEYVVISGNNCTNTRTTSVRVLPSPQAIFSVPPACDGDLIDFNADGTNNLSSATYTWTLSDSIRTGQSIQHRFPGTNIYGVALKVEYPAYNNDPTLVCKDSLRLDQTVGAVPKDLRFKYFNVCQDDETTFEIQPDIPVSKVSWDFGDQISTGFGFTAENIQGVPNTSGTFQAPGHTYAGAGNFDVVVTGKTADIYGGCEHTELHNIAILKNWSPAPGDMTYDMSQLDGGRGFWVTEDQAGNASWEFNTAAKQRIITDELAWVTGSTEPYKAEDVSFVNSPCFDLTPFTRPVLSLKHWTDTEASDGAVLQYSIDGGETWNRLGNVASGLDWYNRLTISSNPGQQTDLSSGWSLTEQFEWATGKHTLDVIPTPRNQVRFRVAFSSFNNVEGRGGFAFNNVLIEERNRTILLENFSNLQETDNNTAFKDFRSVNGVFNPAELVKLQYHHASAQNASPPDAVHRANPVDQNARAAFYGVTSAARAFVDGGFGQTSTNATFTSSTLLERYFSLRSLVTSPIDIAIDFETEPSDKLNVTATVQATAALGNPGEYNVFIAIAERDTLGQIYVLRKFLPDASGTPLTSLSAFDPAQEINVSYDMRQVSRLQNGDFAPFAVIVFVQNLQTKNVLQTAMRQDGTASAQIVTGVETSADRYIRLYPNPADDIINMILPAPVKAETPVRIFDSFGRQVYAGTFGSGEDRKAVETKLFSAGVYLIQLSTPEGEVRKKAMIVHE